MCADKLITGSSLLTLVMALAGAILYGWHLAIHPAPQLSDPGEPAPLRTEGMAALVSVANLHNQASALHFNASFHGRELRNFRLHLQGIASQRGWYLHYGGDWPRLVVPERDLPMLREMEAYPIGWVLRHDGGSVSAGPFQEQSWSTPPYAPVCGCFPAPCGSWASQCGRWPRSRPWSSCWS